MQINILFVEGIYMLIDTVALYRLINYVSIYIYIIG